VWAPSRRRLKIAYPGLGSQPALAAITGVLGSAIARLGELT
jgi:hypothetical protein